jgi:hypothetical protein
MMDDARSIYELEDELPSFDLRDLPMPMTLPRKMSGRISSPLPIPFVLPSKKMLADDSDF